VKGGALPRAGAAGMTLHTFTHHTYIIHTYFTVVIDHTCIIPGTVPYFTLYSKHFFPR
jgi:hypothetical protein